MFFFRPQVLTFLIDPSRFHYPERAIVFLAVCYLVVGCAFVAGLGAGDSVACREPFEPPARLRGLKMISTITQVSRQERSFRRYAHVSRERGVKLSPVGGRLCALNAQVHPDGATTTRSPSPATFSLYVYSCCGWAVGVHSLCCV